MRARVSTHFLNHKLGNSAVLVEKGLLIINSGHFCVGDPLLHATAPFHVMTTLEFIIQFEKMTAATFLVMDCCADT